jgi:hypothetical protein
LPVLLLLLVIGQMSAEICRARCEAMPCMAHCHDASCRHASANFTRATLLASETCSGQICRNPLWLPQNRPDHESMLSITSVPFNVPVPEVLEGEHPVRFRTGRSTESIPPFDPLISSLRI